MQFIAKSRYVSCSPYKLRPFADVIRGKKAVYARDWLFAYRSARSRLLKKVLDTAIANAKHLRQVDEKNLVVKTIMIDGGPIQRYFKPGAQGRAQPQARRMSHIQIVLESIE